MIKCEAFFCLSRYRTVKTNKKEIKSYNKNIIEINNNDDILTNVDDVKENINKKSDNLYLNENINENNLKERINSLCECSQEEKENNLNKSMETKNNLNKQIGMMNYNENKNKTVNDNNDNLNLTCSICLEFILKGKTCHKKRCISVLSNCCHVFCPQCISTWRLENNTCPLCRTESSLAYFVYDENWVIRKIEKQVKSKTNVEQNELLENHKFCKRLFKKNEKENKINNEIRYKTKVYLMLLDINKTETKHSSINLPVPSTSSSDILNNSNSEKKNIKTILNDEGLKTLLGFFTKKKLLCHPLSNLLLNPNLDDLIDSEIIEIVLRQLIKKSLETKNIKFNSKNKYQIVLKSFLEGEDLSNLICKESLSQFINQTIQYIKLIQN